MVTTEGSDGIPPDSYALYLRAQAACELLNYGYAISILEKVVSTHPEFDKAWGLLKFAQDAKRGLE